MPSQLYSNEKISFLACKPFIYRDSTYEVGDDFPQEEANNIETLVRARYVIPFVEDLADKPRHWHQHVRTREQAEEYLTRSRVQLMLPTPLDSDDVVNLSTLTRPETTPEPTDEEPEAGEDATPEPAQAAHEDAYDPSYHTVVEVKAYLAHTHDPEEKERILESERANRGRKGILED